MKKRFISGAICPECQSQDTLRWWQANEKDHLDCVACDYQTVRETTESTDLASKSASSAVIFQTPLV